MKEAKHGAVSDITELLSKKTVTDDLLCIYLPGTLLNVGTAGSIPADVIGFFIDIKSFRSHYGPGVDSASNTNEYKEYFLGVKAAGA